MRVAREGGRSDLDLVVALARGAGLATDSTAASAEVIREIAAKALAQGDPARGERIYRRNDLACLSCHSIGGPEAGWDRTHEHRRQRSARLSRGIPVVAERQDQGRLPQPSSPLKGTAPSSPAPGEGTPEEVVLRNAAGTEQAIPKTDIAKREQGTLSLMPGGLLDP